MKYGLTIAELEFVQSNIVDPLSREGAQIYLFGSRARGNYQKFSDVDIMVESKTDLTKQISKIKENAQNSAFPYKIDLVSFNEFSESYKSNYMKERIRLF